MPEQYIQVGITAARSPKTGKYLSAVPIYIEGQLEIVEIEELIMHEDEIEKVKTKMTTYESMMQDAAKLFAAKMREYIKNAKKGRLK